MKIHEYQAIQLFKNVGIPTPGGETVSTLDDGLAVAKRLGFPVVLKSQVLVGGRGKAGGIKVVNNDVEFKEHFIRIRALKIKGYSVEKIFIVPAVDIKKEFYAAVAIDNIKSDVVLIVSAEGGVDIEETAKKNPQAIKKFYLNGQKTIDTARWPEFVKSIFSDEADQKIATGVLQKLLAVFFTNDCSIAEINPLVKDAKGQWFAADAKVNFDDNAIFRHVELESLRDLSYEDADEIEAKNLNLSFVKMDGTVGCIVNGAGLAMATLDTIKLLGGEPANFLDVGGSSNSAKVLNALKIILRNKNVKSILVNIFGGITRCDDIANGIIEARKQLNIQVPMSVRLIGTNEKEAAEILKRENIISHPTMRSAVEEAVKLAKR
ncbi:MAG: ADP-forming succinate--CoA ligase subunit beta [Candidatus Omnitrophica bacterium]|nr:ADP-forming succinate--CoA ligase subunit beta [Candidatus Omnitrophota bacterium]